jgi:hypothetical protein
LEFKEIGQSAQKVDLKEIIKKIKEEKTKNWFLH